MNYQDQSETNKLIIPFQDEKRRGAVTKLCNRNSLNTNDLEISRLLSISQLAEIYPESIKVIQGGIPGEVTQGTWFQEDIALEFARWLSPD